MEADTAKRCYAQQQEKQAEWYYTPHLPAVSNVGVSMQVGQTDEQMTKNDFGVTWMYNLIGCQNDGQTKLVP